MNNKWYLKDGTQNHYEYVMWLDVERPEDLKTSEQWNKIYNKSVLDPDGWDRNNFQYSWFEEKISEREFTSRLVRSTTQL